MTLPGLYWEDSVHFTIQVALREPVHCKFMHSMFETYHKSMLHMPFCKVPALRFVTMFLSPVAKRF